MRLLHAPRQGSNFGGQRSHAQAQIGILMAQRLRQFSQLVDFLGKKMKFGNHLATIVVQTNSRQQIQRSGDAFSRQT